MKQTLLTLTITFFCQFPVLAQPAGTLDFTFNNTGTWSRDFGFQDNLQEVVVQPADQKIVSVGSTLNATFSGKLLVMRQLPDGTLDTTFRDSGFVVIPDFNESYAYDCFIKNDGKILVAGAAADPQFVFSSVVIRFHEDGTLDSTFGVNGFALANASNADDFAYAITEQPDHKILLAGTAIDASFNNVPTVIRLNEDGGIDSTFGVNGIAQIPVTEIDNELTSISLLPDGRIVVSGHYGNPLTPGGQFDFDVLVARFNPDGTPDITFGTNGVVITPVSADNVEDVFGMVIMPDQKITVGGFVTLTDFSYDLLLMQYDSTGVLNPAFGTNGLVQWHNDVQDVAFDLALQDDGKILAAGTSGGFFFDDRDFLLMRYFPDGSPDSTFNGTGYALNTILQGFDEANGMALQADDRIVLAGKTFNGSNNDVALARYLNDQTVAMPDGLSGSSWTVTPNPVRAGSSLTCLLPGEFRSLSGLELLNTMGEKVQVYKNGDASPGPVKSVLIPESLPAGLYFIRCATIEGRVFHARVVVCR